MSTAAFQLTPAERPTYAHLFALADPQTTGMVNGSAAVSFFALSGLPTPVLGSIWSIADSDGNGFLGPAQFSAALRLIGHAQNGKVVTEDLAREAGPIPTFKGITIPAHLTGGGFQTPSRSSSTMVQPQVTGGGFGTSEIKPEDRARYTRIFTSAGPQNGLLDGEKAKEIFVKSKLPFDKLGAIWNLADTKARGKLDLTDFIVGMHFIQSTMNGTLTTIPASLPAGLYEKAAGGLPSSPSFASLGAQHTGSLGPQLSRGSTGFISRQMTGSNPVPSRILSPPPTTGTPLKPQRTGSMFPTLGVAASNWAVTPADKAKSDRFFDGLDQDRQGVLEGQAAVPFFMQSGLNETTLAHVWDLSDVTQSGSLTRDEFAVAMHLINLKITGSDLPSELPNSLVPPSLRGTNLPQAVNPKETDTQKDLFSLMDDDFDLPVSTASAFAVPAPSAVLNQGRSAPSVTTGPFDDDFLGSSTTSAGATSPFLPAILSGAPTTISPNMTGTSNMGGSSRFAAPISEQATGRSAFQAPFADPSSEAVNQRLALESTQKSLSNLESTKAELSKTTSSDANSISDLNTRLETVRMRHQTETEAVKALTDRQAAQALELKKLREESVRDESELSRLKQEKDEIEQSVLKDREDVREMKRLVAERTKEKDQLKLELEKLKKEARLQKGLVAIGKKQLNQSELEVDSVKQEMEDVKLSNAADEEVQHHADHGEVAMNSGTRELAAGPEAVLSPTGSVRSNNPFDRIPGAGLATGVAAAGLASAAGLGAVVAQHESTPAPSSTTDNTIHDPFGAGNTSTNVPVTTSPAPEAAFDDSFGHFDAPTQPVANAGGGHSNQAFDDAFADFDDPSTKEVAPAAVTAATTAATTESEDISSAVPGSFAAAETASPPAIPTEEYAEPAQREISSPLGAAALSLHEPSVDPISSEADEAPLQSNLDKGKGLLKDEEHEDSSDEEEEGPEDVESTAKRTVDSPDEIGQGKAAIDPIGAAYPDITSNNIPEVANRFPDIADESTTAKAPIQAINSSDILGKPFASSAITASPHVGDDSGASNVDAFHDAYSGNTPSKDELEAGAGDGGFMEVTSHDRYSTALDNGSVSQRSVSPSKIRRAPPPAPARGGTLSSVASPVINSGPFGASAPAPIDDFDAAFEDLGPTGGGMAANTSTSTTTGFDDAFGDADDFDFVPSFSNQNGSSSFGAAATTKSATTQSTAQTGGFDGFDSNFDSAFNPSTTAGPKSQAAPPLAVNTTTSSGTGSGFSFEDAFGDPAPQTAGSFSTATSTTSKAPPSLPSRGATTTTTSGVGALPDDAAPVRQLCAMGFSRVDVIKSLEKSNYRTDKALERLLAQA